MRRAPARFSGRSAAGSSRSPIPTAVAVKGMGLERLPALVWLKTDLTIGGAAEGWDPHEWKALCDKLAEVMSWKGPLIPERDDPAAFAGTPAAG